MMIAFALMLQAAAPTAQTELGEVELGEGEIRQMLMIAQSREGSAVEKALTLKGAELEAALRVAVADRTKVTYQEDEGIVVQYASPDGQLRIWYPGSRSPVIGRWGVQRMSKKLVNACFRSPAPVDPAVTPFLPSECVRAEQTLSSGNVLRQWHGDVFGLMRGVPYVKSTMGLPTP